MNYTAEQLKAWAASAADIRGEDADGVAQLRAHAAALEENARLKRHAEAMALDLEVWDNNKLDKSWQAYRADFPKEPR